MAVAMSVPPSSLVDETDEMLATLYEILEQQADEARNA